MNERGFDRIAEAFMADGPTVLADRVFDVAFDEVHLTRQRRVLWGVPWRFPTMNSFAKVAVAAVAVIAVGLLGLTFLRPGGTGGVGAPSAAPSASVAPSATSSPSSSPARTASPLTGQFTSDRYGFSIAYPETWLTRDATTPWTSGYVDYSQESGDIMYEPSNPGNLWVAVASQPLGDRTPEEFEADVDQALLADNPGGSSCSSVGDPITVDGAPGIMCGGQVALVTDGGRGYFILLYTSGDEAWIGEVHDRAWFESILATVKLHPEDAVDAVASPSPS